MFLQLDHILLEEVIHTLLEEVIHTLPKGLIQNHIIQVQETSLKG